jgi:glutaredoxin-like protein
MTSSSRDADRADVSEALAALVVPVQLIFFEQSIGCETCPPTRQLLEQLAGLNERITLEKLNLVLDKDRAAQYGVDRVPAIVVSAPGRDRIRFYGAPFGNELMSLVEAIGMTGTGQTDLSDRSRAQLKTLSTPVDVKVFFTPTCVYCPRMITLSNQIAIESPLVKTTAIDATEYPDLVHRYKVNGVPKTVINDTLELLGAISEEDLVKEVSRFPNPDSPIPIC